MSVLEIKKYPDKVLKKKSEEIKEITQEIKEIVLDMIETMEKNEGVGLAAPQVGILKRIIAVQTETGPKVFINPKILKKSAEKIIDEEGCLSVPGIRLKIKRAKSAEVKAIDEGGKEVLVKAEGLLARVFQHEIDHLDGKLFIDRLNFWQRWKIRKELKNIKKYASG